MPGISTSSRTRSKPRLAASSRRLFAVHRERDVVAPLPEAARQSVSIQLVVVDNEQGASSCHGLTLHARSDSIFPSRRSNLTGLLSKSSPPAASAVSRSLVIACALRTMIGMCCVAGVRSSAAEWLPSRPSREAQIHQDEIGLFRTWPSRPPVVRLPATGRYSRVARAGATARRGSVRCLRPAGWWASSAFFFFVVSSIAKRRSATLRATRPRTRRAGGTTKREPSPGRLSTEIVRPSAHRIASTMASPRPVPPYLRVVVTSAWVNGSKIFPDLLGRHPNAGVGQVNIDARPVPRRAGHRGVMAPSRVNLRGVAQEVQQDLPRFHHIGASSSRRRRCSARSSVFWFFCTSGPMVSMSSWTSRAHIERLDATATSCRPRSSTDRGCR